MKSIAVWALLDLLYAVQGASNSLAWMSRWAVRSCGTQFMMLYKMILTSNVNFSLYCLMVLLKLIWNKSMCGATTDIVIASTIQIGNISACVRTKQYSCEAVEVTLQVYFMYITDCNAKFFKLPSTSANKLECTMPAVLRQEIPT